MILYLLKCVDPDPYYEYTSRSTKLLIWIQYESGSTTLLIRDVVGHRGGGGSSGRWWVIGEVVAHRSYMVAYWGYVASLRIWWLIWDLVALGDMVALLGILWRM